MSLYGICREEGRCVCGLCEGASKAVYSAGRRPDAKHSSRPDTLPTLHSRITCPRCGGKNGGHFHWCAATDPPVETYVPVQLYTVEILGGKVQKLRPDAAWALSQKLVEQNVAHAIIWGKMNG